MSLILVYPLIIICCHKIQWHIHHLHVCSSSTPEFNILLSIGRTWQHQTHVYLASGPPFHSHSYATHDVSQKKTSPGPPSLCVTYVHTAEVFRPRPYICATVQYLPSAIDSERPDTTEPRIRHMNMNTAHPKVVSQAGGTQVPNTPDSDVHNPQDS